MSAMILLPDGRNVNLCTNEGASAFFATDPRFVSTWTEQASQMLMLENSTPLLKKGASNNNQKLVVLYQLLGVMAESLTTEQMATLEDNQFEFLVEFIKTRFNDISCTPTWRSTGTLGKPDQELLDTIVPWLRHAKFVQCMMESGGFQVLSKLVARDHDESNNNKPTMMAIPEVTETILMIVNNAILTLKGKSTTEEFSNKRDLMNLEETGLLAQSLRCLTVPVTHGSVSQYLQIIDFIEANTILLQHRFVPGTPTGDILQGLIAGKDGWKKSKSNELVMTRLEALQKLAIMANENQCPENDVELSRICRHCGTTGMELKKQDEYRRLLRCSVCKNAYYCDKTCQRADYKQHQKTCHANALRPMQPVQNIIMSFIQQNYVAIMTKMKEVCVENGIDKKDALLEIDFYKNLGEKDASRPALDGSFSVAPVNQALEGDRPAEPDWFYRGTNVYVYESNVALFHEGLRDHHNRMTCNHVLVAYRGTDGNAGVYRVDMMSEKTGFHICSDEALELFPQDTLEKKMKLIMLQSGHQPVGGESEEDLKRFMEMFRGGMKV